MRSALLALALVACTPQASKATPDGDVVAPPVALPTTASSAPAPAGAAQKPRFLAPPDDTDALATIRTQRLQSKAIGRVLVVYIGATWCSPCKVFRAEVASGALDARLGRVDLLDFDIDRDADRLAAAGYTTRFVPFVALPGVDGRPADHDAATGKGSHAWREMLDKLDAWQR